MKRLFILLFTLMIVSCAGKQINVLNVWVEDSVLDTISQDTIELINSYDIDRSNSVIYIFSISDNYVDIFEHALRKSGYSVYVTTEEQILSDTDYTYSYIIDSIEDSKTNDTLLLTLRYTFIFNNKTCSKLYEITDYKTIFYKSNWVCVGGE